MDHIRNFDWNNPESDSDSQHFVNERDIDGSCIEKILRDKFFDPLAEKPNENKPINKINWAGVFKQKSESENSNENEPEIKINWADVFKQDSESENSNENEPKNKMIWADESENPNENKPKNEINWAYIFKQESESTYDIIKMLHVPGLKDIPPYPNLSALTGEQHRQCLKVLCSLNPGILPTKFVQEPNSQDYMLYEKLKQEYEKEQKLYEVWAKSLWRSSHKIRALKPPDYVENVYEAEFNMRMKELQCLPNNYEFAAQIPFESKCMDELKMLHQEQLINNDMRSLPQVNFPDTITKHISILKQYPTPKPCEKHPCKFILPNESTITELPLTQVNMQLAQYCLDNDCQFIASETALRCILETDRSWMVLVNVCPVVNADGIKHNIVVLGSEFSINRQFSTFRTYKAYRHLLYNTLVPSKESKCCTNKNKNSEDKNKNSEDDNARFMDYNFINDPSDDEDDKLVIDFDPQTITEPDDGESNMLIDGTNDVCSNDATMFTFGEQYSKSNESDITDEMASISGCTCKHMFRKPFPRSYSKWTIKSKEGKDLLNFIVHYSHKCRNSMGEVVLEPIPEYQLDLGASAQSEEKIMSLAMMLYLRRECSLLNVRVDGQTGEVVCGDSIYLEGLLNRRDDVIDVATRRIYSTLEHLSRLELGNYILSHEPQHGLNALLYVAKKVKSIKSDSINLDFDLNAVDEEKESEFLKTTPVLTPALLPCHKFRDILPLAFTTSPHQIVKELTTITTNKTKTPPKAITWPKRRLKRKNH